MNSITNLLLYGISLIILIFLLIQAIDTKIYVPKDSLIESLKGKL
jgi:hypothetical protein